LSISSPFAKEGVFYETHAKRWGDNESDVLCWQAPSLTMNPTLDPAVVAAAYRDDEAAARAECGALFRDDVASFIDRDVVQPCRHQLRRLQSSTLPPLESAHWLITAVAAW
jgi:hypothetical protein